MSPLARIGCLVAVMALSWYPGNARAVSHAGVFPFYGDNHGVLRDMVGAVFVDP